MTTIQFVVRDWIEFIVSCLALCISIAAIVLHGGPVEFKITASTRQLLQDVAERHVYRPGWARICEDINRRTWQRVDIRIARLHAAGLVDLAGCPGNWFLTDAGRALLAHCRLEGGT